MQRRPPTDAGEPAKQVIGFSVEGQTASPVPIRAILDEAAAAEEAAAAASGGGGVGSPSLVMIPPAGFQGQTDEPRVVIDRIDLGGTSPGGTFHPAGMPIPIIEVPVASPVRRAITAENFPCSPPAGGTPTGAGAPPRSRSMPRSGSGNVEAPVPSTPAAQPKGEPLLTSPPGATPPAPADSAGSQRSAQTAGGPSRRKSAEAQQEAASAPPVSPAPAAVSPPATGKGKGAKGPPADIQSKPKLSKAERRALQEQQRAAKAAAKADGGGAQGGSKPVPTKHSSAKMVEKEKPAPATKQPEAAAPKEPTPDPRFPKQLELFAHLQQFHHIDATRFSAKDMAQIHPAVKDLGLKYAERTITGSNARCVAMLSVLKTFISHYTTPPQKMLSRDLTARLNKQIDFLAECRPLAVAMGNAIKHLKMHVQHLDPGLPEERAKAILTDTIDNFIMEKIVYADKALVSHAVTKINDGDVVMTYAYSHVVLETLLTAHRQGRKFEVIIIDARPQREGRKLMAKLLEVGVNCSYEHINALSFIIKQVSKVFLGAAAVLSNGVVLSRVGSAAVGMMANNFNVPVLVCCETYKFNERVQLDSITSNELGDPNALTAQQPSHASANCSLLGWEDQSNLILLNLTYDAMPAEFVTMVITEVGMVPPSSVPAILREYMKDSKLEHA